VIKGYTSAFEPLSECFSEVHSLDRLITDYDKSLDTDAKYILLRDQGKTILRKLQAGCTHIALSYERIKGYKCGVCIKLITNDKFQPTAKTVARDDYSKNENNRTSTDSSIHKIELNTDFKKITNEVARGMTNTHFLSNDLISEQQYDNSNLPLNYNSNASRRQKKAHWKLKYQSTIVVPILPLKNQDAEKYVLKAFLCIDAPRKKSFNKTDLMIMRGVADGLFNKIDKLYDKIPK
jgi:hypothetical protein